MTNDFKNKSTLLNALRMYDNAAFEYLYRQYYKAIAKLILQNKGTIEDCREIFQESLLVLLKKLKTEPTFVIQAEVGTYLYGIAKNLWFTELNKNKTNKTIFVEDYKLYEEEIAETEINDQKLEFERKILKVNKAIELLKQECKEIINAAFYQKLSGEAIAKKLGYTEDFVRVKKFRCLEELRKKVNAL